jgi:hypothetical protein
MYMSHIIDNVGTYIIISSCLLVLIYNVYNYVNKQNKIYLIIIVGTIAVLAGLLISYQNKKIGDMVAQIGYIIFSIGLTLMFLNKIMRR